MSARSGTRRGEGGAVTVEAAIITGLVFVMIFGLIEVSFLVRDYVSVTSLARAGARIASTGADAGPCVVEPEDTVPCPAYGAPELAQLAADSVASVGTALPSDSVRYVMVYKANAAGYPGAYTSMPDVAGCTTDCVAYRWSASQNRFRYAQGSWDSRTISACVNPSRGPLDAVGVQVVVDRKMLTGFFGSTMTLSDSAVIRFEPLSNYTCAAGEHQ